MRNPLKTIEFIFTVLFISFFISSPLKSQDPKQSLINVGNITSWVSDEGFHKWIIAGSWNGAFPKDLSVGVIFSEGILWGGLVNDGQSKEVRVSGNHYVTGCAPNTRLYRVRTDYYTADLTEDAASFFNKDQSEITEDEIQQVKDQYQKDWKEWPGNNGAPYYDVDGDGNYDPKIDYPGVPGALQTIWINYNDSLSDSSFSTAPLGLEIQETYWAFAKSGVLGNMIYKRVDLIYNGTSTSSSESKIDSMYICQWSDPDIGAGTDDYAGCDTSLNLGYVYNSDAIDDIYSYLNISPPAVGYSFLQGVSKYSGDLSDSAIFNFKWRKGYKYTNLKSMSSFTFSTPSWLDVDYSDYYLSMYNMMRGYLSHYPGTDTYSSTIADYYSGGVFLLTGDPVTNTGKLDPWVTDKGIWVINGPFSLNLGDTAEVVTVLVVGQGEDNLSSVTNLKYNVKGAKIIFDYYVEEMTTGTLQVDVPEHPPVNDIPDNYTLSQNYPNPFNSTTTIRYGLVNSAFVSLILYDVLGREVKRLVNEQQQSGNYEVSINSNELASGVYFYRIIFDNSDNKLMFDGLNKTMKMILLK